jgi:glycosyltransferase involved in cell wall biosynthesis
VSAAEEADMPKEAVLYDLTEFLRAPFRTGIQRVVREILAHWPHDQVALVPVSVSPDGELIRLPRVVFSLIEAFFEAGPAREKAVRFGLSALPLLGRSLPPSAVADYRGLLNAEVFCDPVRIAFYRRLLQARHSERVFFFIHDMLPWTHPEWFEAGGIFHTIDYFRLVQHIPNRAFNSTQTRGEFHARVLRREQAGGIVLPLGSDGLGQRPPSFDPACRTFLVPGSLEPRKNHRVVLDAFEDLWAQGSDARLVLAGRKGWIAEADLARIDRLRREQPLFAWRESPTDEEMAELIAASRATIYPSLGEGFGLPPVESLALGKPTIVSPAVPSTAMLEPLGQVRLSNPHDAAEVRAAVLALLDDRVARRLCADIERLTLPRWADMGPRFASWIMAHPAGLPSSRGGAAA